MMFIFELKREAGTLTDNARFFILRFIFKMLIFIYV